ncbi:methyltransferase domain-containing protein [Noviherbaspirillum sp. CPCC 100848]|uniref:Methyltransferase domain-containing protein n=1 Tax=Noviherbaspirillum album TaxID=3080276 RepID=A0ABU6J3N7_9BURK|nr:methyltransferase domain-containing protein [Noviherbaspirillum sp. CPCC 100848]MEC4717824.1 methyltransferase domain-containing protein [Noviherbaspirillum sp. CPCC 100848]
MRHSSVALAYDDLAERWLDERFSHTDGVQQHTRALKFLAEGISGWALNVGCGCNTRFNPILRERGLEIEGVDISERMVALAKAADPTVTVHHADVCAWQPPRRYRFISAWDSIWHVPLAEQRSLMLKLMSALEMGGVFIFSAGGLDGPQEHVDSAMGPSVYYSTLGIPDLLDVIKDAGCVCRHFELDQYPQRHLYIIVQRFA